MSFSHGLLLFIAGLSSQLHVNFASTDPLPSWNDTATKRAIVSFVDCTTRIASPDFVPPDDRIAVFDDDGTLWAEQPAYFQTLFTLDRLKALAPQHPEWKEKEPFASLLEGPDGMKAAMSGGERAVLDLILATQAGMSTEEFDKTVRQWFASARHPQTGRPYSEMVYLPMQELIAFLQAHRFKTYIVSGDGIEFMRPWAEKVYGIPPEQVIGSSIKTVFKVKNGEPVLERLPEVDLVDDKAGKPAGIQKFIGRRPIFAFGNSDGDLEMLEWTAGGKGPRFTGLVHHTDAQREWAYDRQSPVGALDKALDEAIARQWTVVDMKADWKQVFSKSGSSF